MSEELRRDAVKASFQALDLSVTTLEARLVRLAKGSVKGRTLNETDVCDAILASASAWRSVELLLRAVDGLENQTGTANDLYGAWEQAEARGRGLARLASAATTVRALYESLLRRTQRRPWRMDALHTLWAAFGGLGAEEGAPLIVRLRAVSPSRGRGWRAVDLAVIRGLVAEGRALAALSDEAAAEAGREAWLEDAAALLGLPEDREGLAGLFADLVQQVPAKSEAVGPAVEALLAHPAMGEAEREALRAYYCS